MIFGDLGGIKLPDICLTGDEKPRKTSPRKRPDWGTKPARCVIGAHATVLPTGMDRFLQVNELLGYLAEEARFRVELFCCTTMHVRILPGRQKPCCVSNFIGTSSSILRTVRTWHPRTIFCFQKWRNTLLVNASQMMKTRRMLSVATCHDEGIHKLMPRDDKCLNVKGDYVEG